MSLEDPAIPSANLASKQSSAPHPLTLNQLFSQLERSLKLIGREAASQSRDSTAISTSSSESVNPDRFRQAYQQLREAAQSIMTCAFTQFQLDSRQVADNDAFILLKSQSNDLLRSRQYLEQAQQRAAFILSEVDPDELGVDSPACPLIFVPDIRHILGSLIQASFILQANAAPCTVTLPRVAAVTGTNGKTTISQLLAQLCQGAGMNSAVMGTAGNGRLGQLTQASHTTGDALAVQRFLWQMANEDVTLLALEASSHGLDQQRLQGVPIEVALYSNLSRDHLDYHADMQEYAAAKANLFDKAQFPHLTHAIINSDDEFAPLMIETARASGLEIWTYSTRADAKATLVARQIQPSLQGVTIQIASPLFDQSGRGEETLLWVESPLLGLFNVANLLAAIGGALALGVDCNRIAELVQSLQGASGRMQRVPANQGCYIVDYAHTPDALSQVLSSLKAHCEGQLWAVFGCGGDRDAGKRPLMAQAGLQLADRVILTADNPRSEDPLAILADMQAGMSAEQQARTLVEPSRRQAIMTAIEQAGADDIVVIAGKGHETYQEINGVRHDFDDRLVVAEALMTFGKADR